MRKLMWFSIGFALSCVIGIYLISGKILAWMALFAIIAAAALFFLKRILCRATSVVLLGFAVGVLWMWGYQAIYLQPAKQYDGQTVTTTIEIADYSYATDYGATADGTLKLAGKIYRVRVYLGDEQNLNPGDCLQGDFTLGMTTPDGKEASDYYQGKGIFLLAKAQDGVTAHRAGAIPAKYFAAKLRRQITDLLDAVFPADTLGFVRALLLGDSSLLTYEEDTSFKVSGIRHVIAVSGLHVSILFALVYTVACRHKVWTAVLGIPILVLFAAVAGFSPSIIRACIMQSLMMLALLLNKEYDPPTALATAVLVMLAVNPMTITSVSFQLSVGCMIGIFLFSRPISGYILKKLGSPKGKSLGARLARWFSSGVSVTLSAMTFTTPLVAWYFGMVSLVGVLTNLITLWVISFVFYGILLACICGAIWLPLGKVIAWIISWPVRYVLLAAKTAASLPLAAVYTCSVYIVLWIGVCYLLFGVFLICKRKNPILLMVCILICLSVSVTASYIAPRLDDFRVTVFDVGEGQSILLQTNGKHYLVDCGGSSDDKAADVAAETLLSQGVFTLDGLILTHYDADHVGGVQGLLSRVDVKALYLPDIPDDGDTKEKLVHTYGNQVSLIQENTSLDTVTLIPARADAEDENESSLCVLFQVKNCDILITGDRGKIGEKALLQDFALPKLELLVAGHHGSGNSTTFELLSATMPDTVVISNGGRYGHPAPEVLRRLELFGCKVWRTDERGTIIFRG